jgi:hypothetical protein
VPQFKCTRQSNWEGTISVVSLFRSIGEAKLVKQNNLLHFLYHVVIYHTHPLLTLRSGKNYLKFTTPSVMSVSPVCIGVVDLF